MLIQSSPPGVFADRFASAWARTDALFRLDPDFVYLRQLFVLGVHASTAGLADLPASVGDEAHDADHDPDRERDGDARCVVVEVHRGVRSAAATSW